MKLNKHIKEQGFSKLLMIIISVVVVIIVAGITLWLIPNSPINNAVNNITSAVKAAGLDISKCTFSDKDVCRFVAANEDMTEYTAVISGTSNGLESKMTVESDKAGNSRLASTSGSTSYESISTPTTTYMRTNGGEWQKTTRTTAETDDTDTKVLGSIDTKDESSFKLVGKEACGTSNCFKYRVTSEESADTNTLVWFDTNSYLIHKMTFESNGSVSTIEYTFGAVTIAIPTSATEV